MTRAVEFVVFFGLNLILAYMLVWGTAWGVIAFRHTDVSKVAGRWLMVAVFVGAALATLFRFEATS